jgi:WD40 repeat protein
MKRRMAQEFSTDLPSIEHKARPFDLGAHVVAAHFTGDSCAFATGEGEVLIAGDKEARVKPHQGAILNAVGNGERIFTAGDDGRLVATDIEGEMEVIAEIKNKWIDQVALGPDGSLAWSAGRTVFVKTKKGDKTLDLPSTPGGLAFAPKGFRLGIAHYNGASLWFPNSDTKPELLEWKGSHTGALFSPDGRFLVTTMQEAALHGWRLMDAQDMRMSGYPSRVRSISFNHDGDWLATSGAQEVILWPFRTRDGPMGKPPRMIAPAANNQKVTCVACHPKQPAMAAGYSDGAVLLVRLEDGAEILVTPASGAPVSALAWRADGQSLAFGTEAGKGGLLAL